MAIDLYEALRESHRLQRALCRALLRTPPGGNHRRDVFTQLRVELAAHAAAEERYLYVPMLMHDEGLNSSRHALHEHHQIDEIIEDMRVVTRTGAAWMANARKLSKKVHHHLKEEERKFFQVSGKLLSKKQKRELGASYVDDYQRMRERLQSL